MGFPMKHETISRGEHGEAAWQRYVSFIAPLRLFVKPSFLACEKTRCPSALRSLAARSLISSLRETIIPGCAQRLSDRVDRFFFFLIRNHRGFDRLL